MAKAAARTLPSLQSKPRMEMHTVWQGNQGMPMNPPSFRRGIAPIIGIGTHKEVGRIATWGKITPVTHAQCAQERQKEGMASDKNREPVCGYGALPLSDLNVPMPRHSLMSTRKLKSMKPWPATTLAGPMMGTTPDVRPETVLNRIHRVNTPLAKERSKMYTDNSIGILERIARDDIGRIENIAERAWPYTARHG